MLLRHVLSRHHLTPNSLTARNSVSKNHHTPPTPDGDAFPALPRRSRRQRGTRPQHSLTTFVIPESPGHQYFPKRSSALYRDTRASAKIHTIFLSSRSVWRAAGSRSASQHPPSTALVPAPDGRNCPQAALGAARGEGRLREAGVRGAVRAGARDRAGPGETDQR